MAIQTLWTATLRVSPDGVAGVTASLFFDDQTLTLTSLTYTNDSDVDYIGHAVHNGVIRRQKSLPAGTSGSWDISGFGLAAVATAMPSWTQYDLPLGWTLSIGVNS